MFAGVVRTPLVSFWRSSLHENWCPVSISRGSQPLRGRVLRMASTTGKRTLRLLTQAEAQRVDEELMSDAYGYTLEQLMELAGLAVALATARECPNRCENVVAVCGPGNNGGDGLVAARHLRLFGYEHVQAIYPRPGGSNHFQRLVKQAQVHGVQFVDQAAFGRTIQDADVLIDAIFGFSFRAERPIREPYASLIRHMNESSRAHTVIAVDVPSGWDVEHGPPSAAQTSESADGSSATMTAAPDGMPKAHPTVRANVWVSLTAPKRCAARWQGRAHYLGGRFIPPALAQKMDLLPLPYTGTELIARIDEQLPTE